MEMKIQWNLAECLLTSKNPVNGQIFYNTQGVKFVKMLVMLNSLDNENQDFQ
jgi:hypothetical protein